MVDFRVVFTIVFFVALAWYVYARRSGMQTQKVLPPLLYFSMYRTTWGLKKMDSWARKYGGALHWLGIAGVIAGFLGMVFISYALIKNLFSLFMQPDTAPGVGLVLPFKAKGIFYVPIEYWVICIFIIALVHEFSHGVLSRVYGVRVKSSGFAFAGTTFRTLGIILLIIGLWGNVKEGPGFVFDLSSSPDILMVVGIILIAVSIFGNITAPIIPAAFVEPDEKKLRNKALMQQLAVFAAGPFSNVVLGFIALGFLIAMAPLSSDMVEANGVQITDFVDGEFPAEAIGIQKGEIVQSVNGVKTPYLENLSAELQKRMPGDTIQLATDKKEYAITLSQNPDNQSMAYLGAYLSQSSDIKPDVKERYGFIPYVVIWIAGLLMFLFILNLGIGLFNLVPIGPLDGGRMLHIVLMTYMDKTRAMKVFGMVGMFFIIIVIMNIFFPFLKPLF